MLAYGLRAHPNTGDRRFANPKFDWGEDAKENAKFTNEDLKEKPTKEAAAEEKKRAAWH